MRIEPSQEERALFAPDGARLGGRRLRWAKPVTVALLVALAGWGAVGLLSEPGPVGRTSGAP